jgi:type II secretory pathway pseudopilin PulG
MTRSDQSGFSLIEIVIAVPISVILIGALAGSLFVGWRTTAGTETKLADSHDAQMLQFYLVPELQSVAPGGINTSPGTVCDCSNGSGPSEPGSNVLTLKWLQQTFGITKTFDVSYRLVDPDGVGGPLPANQLYRFACENGAIATGKLMADNLSSSAPPVVTVAPAGAPRKVSVKLTNASGYAYTVESEWRRDA